MIHGNGVMPKYSAIVKGRQAELFAGLSREMQLLKSDQLVEFLDKVRNGTPEEFEEWYQLYK